MALTLALVQLTSGDDVAANIARLETLVAEAAAKGAQFIALPENAFLMEPSGNPHPNPLPKRERGKWTQAEHPGVAAAAKMAAKYKAWLLVGSVAVLPPRHSGESRNSDQTEMLDPGFRRDDGKTCNRSLLFNPKGEIAAQYDKIHLFDVEVGDGQTYKESAKIIPGEKAVVATMPWVKLGMTVCYDVRFPQLYRTLAKQGAEILAVPAAFTQVTGEAHWHVLLRARAIENGCFVIAPAQTGTHPGGRKTFGHSLIIDPWGKILADGGTGEGIVMAEIDLDEVKKARTRIPSLAHDRKFN